MRGIVKKNPQLKLKLKRAGSKQTPLLYINQTITMTIFSMVFLGILAYLFFNNNFTNLLIAFLILVLSIPFVYKFNLSYVDVLISKYGRELDSDLLFISEFLLVTLESGLPIGNAIQRLSELDRPGGRFFKRIISDFKTGKDLEKALDEAAQYSASEDLKILIKRIRDSLDIGIDLKRVLENFIEESSEKKILEIRAFSKKLNPVIMMYLLLGVVLPSLGVTFFIVGAAILEMTPDLLKFILIFIFLLMFGFQYFAYTSFKFRRSTL